VKEVEQKEVKRQAAIRRVSDIQTVEKRVSHRLAQQPQQPQQQPQPAKPAPERAPFQTETKKQKRQLVIQEEEEEVREKEKTEAPKAISRKTKQPTENSSKAPALTKKKSKNLSETSFGFVELTNVEPSAMWGGDVDDDDLEENFAPHTFAPGTVPPLFQKLFYLLLLF